MRHKQPQRPFRIVVIYPSRKAERLGNLAHYDDLLSGSKVTIIYLDELANRFHDSLELELIGLIVADARKPQQLIEQGRRLLKDDRYALSRVERLDWVETILVYQFPKLSREEIQKMLNTFDIDLKQTRFYQDVFGEGKSEGKLEGEHIGLERGLLEGKKIGLERERQLIIRQLKRRLGSLPGATTDKITQLPLSQIEELGEALLDFKDIEDVNSWLISLDIERLDRS